MVQPVAFLVIMLSSLAPCYFLFKGGFFAAPADPLTARTDLSPFRQKRKGEVA
jgi:hypothetical protein